MILLPATLDDAKFLLDLKNDSAVRKNSIVTNKKIEFKNHIKWLTSKISDENTHLFVIYDSGNAVGDIRFDVSPYEIEVSIRIAKKYRGTGVGHQALERGLNLMKILYPGKPCMAKIIDGNLASEKLFTDFGFKKYVSVNYFKK